MNIYLKQMKDALSKCYDTAKKYTENVTAAKRRYQPDVAAEEIKRLDAAFEQEKRRFSDAITAARDNGIESARKWGELDGSKIDDGDMKLLKFDLSSEQFEHLVNKHRANGTMCFILRQYAEKNNRPETDTTEFGLTGRLNPLVIPTVDAKVSAYAKFADSAISIVNNMTGYGLGRGTDSPLLESSVKSFGEPDAANFMLLEMLE